MNSQDLLGLLGLGFGLYKGIKEKKSKKEAEAQKKALMKSAIANTVAKNYKNKLLQQNLPDTEISQRMQKYDPTAGPGYAALYSNYLLTGKFPDKLYDKLYPSGPKTIKYDYSGLGNRNNYLGTGSSKDRAYKNYQKRSDQFLKNLQKTTNATFIPTDEYIKALYEQAGKADYWAKITGNNTKYIGIVNEYVKKLREKQRKAAEEKNKNKHRGILSSITNIFKGKPKKETNISAIKKLQKKLIKKQNLNPLGFE